MGKKHHVVNDWARTVGPEAVENYMAHTIPDECEFFLFFLPFLIAQLGLDVKLTDEGAALAFLGIMCVVILRPLKNDIWTHIFT